MHIYEERMSAVALHIKLSPDGRCPIECRKSLGLMP
jgi:hypothetical protein